MEDTLDPFEIPDEVLDKRGSEQTSLISDQEYLAQLVAAFGDYYLIVKYLITHPVYRYYYRGKKDKHGGITKDYTKWYSENILGGKLYRYPSQVTKIADSLYASLKDKQSYEIAVVSLSDEYRRFK